MLDYKEGLDPTFSTPWESFVLTLLKFNIEGVEGICVGNVDDIDENNVQGGQTGGHMDVDTPIEQVLRLVKNNTQITRKEHSNTIGIIPSAIQKHINRLKVDGIIRRIGGDSGGKLLSE